VESRGLELLWIETNITIISSKGKWITRKEDGVIRKY
jgi:hypothetical protein